MKYFLSFGCINVLSESIAEVLVDEGTIMTLEMCEEYDDFLLDHFTQPFALLINKIHNYSYTYEAKLHIASLQLLKAMAIVTYNKDGALQTQNLVKHREQDGWNLKEFSGLQMGRQKALVWLEEVLASSMIKP